MIKSKMVKKFVSLTVIVFVLLNLTLYTNALSSTQTVTIGESTSQNQNQTVAISGLGSVFNATVNTGNVTYTQSGNISPWATIIARIKSK